jgi:hypothetical protein
MRSPRGEWYPTTVIRTGDYFVHNLVDCLPVYDALR